MVAEKSCGQRHGPTEVCWDHRRSGWLKLKKCNHLARSQPTLFVPIGLLTAGLVLGCSNITFTRSGYRSPLEQTRLLCNLISSIALRVVYILTRVLFTSSELAHRKSFSFDTTSVIVSEL
jgi:hypothetical protein